MKSAFKKDEAFLEDVRRTLDAKVGRLWWLGQSGFLVAKGGRAIVLDPYLSDSLTKKYAQTDKPHARLTERVIDPAALGELGVLDVITSSHNHTDHLDAETLLPLLNLNPQAWLVLPAANRSVALERLGKAVESRIIEVDHAVTLEVAGIQITGVAAAHPSVERDEKGRCRFLGYIIRWGEFVLYHSGDTLLHPGLAPFLKEFAIDLALLPINGDRPERRVAGNLDGAQAAQLAFEIGARCVVPCHYDLFEFNTASPDEFGAACGRLGQNYTIVRNGEGLDINALIPRGLRINGPEKSIAPREH
jgi:L-ascorbate metabolism protein UlaG (beta-lactamase superfamily)